MQNEKFAAVPLSVLKSKRNRESVENWPQISRFFAFAVDPDLHIIPWLELPVSHKQTIDKATGEYRKYKARTLSEVERDYLDFIKLLEQKTDKK